MGRGAGRRRRLHRLVGQLRAVDRRLKDLGALGEVGRARLHRLALRVLARLRTLHRGAPATRPIG